MDESSRSDAQIAHAAMAEKEEFRELYHRYAEHIYRFVRYRVNSDHDAQDLVSTIFLKALERIHQYRDDYAFSTWLYTIARNTIIDFWRSRKTTIDLEKIEDLASRDGNISDELDVFLYIETMMEQLSESERILIILRFEDDLSFTDIARITGRAPGSLRTAFHRLRKKLQPYE